MLAAVLIGSYEPAEIQSVVTRALAMLAGCCYGVMLVYSVARGLTARTVAVDVPTAFGYSMLLALLVLVAWFMARVAAVPELWWLPLAVAAIGEPWLERTPGRAVGKLAITLAATLLVLTLLVAEAGIPDTTAADVDLAEFGEFLDQVDPDDFRN